jgi:hypothetical protein
MLPIQVKEPVRHRFNDRTEFRRAVKKYTEKRDYAAAHKFFKGRLRSVEIMWKGHLEKILFLKPSECEHFTETMKEQYKRSIDFTADEKLSRFIDRSEDLYDQMIWLERLSRFQIYAVIGAQQSKLKGTSFALALLMNFVMLISLTSHEDGHGVTAVYTSTRPDIGSGESAGMYYLMLYAGIIQFVLSALVLGFILANRAPLIYRKERKKFELANPHLSPDQLLNLEAFYVDMHGINSFFDSFKGTLQVAVMVGTGLALMILRWDYHISTVPSLFWITAGLWLGGSSMGSLREYYHHTCPGSAASLLFCVLYDVLALPDIMFYAVYLVTAGLGVGFNAPYLYCFHLFDLILMSEVLQNVVRAVTNSTKQLSMTVLLGLFIFYMFAVVAFYFLQGHLVNDSMVNECETLLFCFMTVLHYGLLSGGGISEYMDQIGNELHVRKGTGEAFLQQFLGRFFFDTLFFVIVIVLLMNIIFGIIIDQFGQLRDQQVENERARQSRCFVCGIDKTRFDSDGQKKGIQRGFKMHVASEHNMWDYLFFLVYLRHKPITEYTGAESFLAKCIEEENIEWVPMNKAITLGEREDEQRNMCVSDDHVPCSAARPRPPPSHPALAPPALAPPAPARTHCRLAPTPACPFIHLSSPVHPPPVLGPHHLIYTTRDPPPPPGRRRVEIQLENQSLVLQAYRASHEQRLDRIIQTQDKLLTKVADLQTNMQVIGRCAAASHRLKGCGWVAKLLVLVLPRPCVFLNVFALLFDAVRC